jgi:hypothetical protein
MQRAPPNISNTDLPSIEGSTDSTSGKLSASPHPWQSAGWITGGVPVKNSVPDLLMLGDFVVRERVARSRKHDEPLIGINGALKRHHSLYKK